MALRDIVGGLHLIKDGNLESVLPYNRILFRALFFEKIVENISNTNHELPWTYLHAHLPTRQ